MDFLAEVYRSLSVLDGAVLLVSAKDGHTGTDPYTVSCTTDNEDSDNFFSSIKLTQEGIDLPMVYREMKAKLSSEIIVKAKGWAASPYKCNGQ